MSRRFISVSLVVLISSICGALHAQCNPATLDSLRQGKVPDFSSAEGCEDGEPTKKLAAQVAKFVSRFSKKEDGSKRLAIAAFIRKVYQAYRATKLPQRVLSSRGFVQVLFAALTSENVVGLKLPEPVPNDIEPIAKAIEEFTPPQTNPFRIPDFTEVIFICRKLISTMMELKWVLIIGTGIVVCLFALFFGCVALVYWSLSRKLKRRVELEEEGRRRLRMELVRLIELGRQPTERKPSKDAENQELNRQLGSLQTQITQLSADYVTVNLHNSAVGELREDLDTFRGLVQDLPKLREQINELQKAEEDRVTGEKELSLTDLVDLELSSLKAGWEKYREQQRQVAILAESAASNPRFAMIHSDLLTDLPRAVGADERLLAACESLLDPVKDFYNFSVRVSRIPGPVDPQVLQRDPGKVLMNIRERAQTLAFLQDGRSGTQRLSFDLEKWIREQFLSFADLLLRTYQEARLDGTSGNLEEGRALVLKILLEAGLEPVEIVLGQTSFDSSKHIGRSTASRPSMRDGTIASVVKNGFQQVGGPVVQQPEVIVNRI